MGEEEGFGISSLPSRTKHGGVERHLSLRGARKTLILLVCWVVSAELRGPVLADPVSFASFGTCHPIFGYCCLGL